jgi:rhodanese-related sulfurtransferase
MISRRTILLGSLVLTLASAAAQGQSMAPIMDAPSAAGLLGAGGLIIDVRTPREQRETGIPKAALRIPLQDDERNFRPGFAQEVLTATGNDLTRPIALIDADGRRAAYAARLLAAQGFTQAFAVGEGLFGSNLGPGWVARGLPLEACPGC